MQPVRDYELKALLRDALGIWIAQRERLDLQRIRQRARASDLLDLLEQLLRQAP